MPASRTLVAPDAYDLALVLGLHRHGRGDPTIRVTAVAADVAMHTPDGAASLAVRRAGSTLATQAWGAGASWTLDHAPRLLGLDDDPASFRPPPGVVRELHRTNPALRLSRSDRVWAALLPAVLEQKVTGLEARRSFRSLVRAYGEPAPGPLRLRLLPAPDRFDAVGYHDLHRHGLEQKRSSTLLRAAAAAPELERAADGDPLALDRALRAIRGVGVWTAAEVRMCALGDPDAVSVGDFHLKHQVTWTLAGERDGTDERMLQLLQPYAGHRGRVCRLIAMAGRPRERRAPRLAPRSIARI